LRTVLVTGTTGFIGRHLLRSLVGEGNRVASLQRSAERLPGVVETLHVPTFSAPNVRAALEGRYFDWVFHLSAYGVRPEERDIESMFRVNVEATRELVRAASNWPAKAVVLASTGSEYRMEHVDGPVGEDSPLETFKLYGASKACATITALSIARSLRLPCAVARIFNVYGPGEAEYRLFPTLVRHLSQGQRAPLSKGDQLRDFLFVKDVVEGLGAIAAALESQASPAQLALNLSSGRPIPMRDFALAVAHELGASPDLLGFGDLPLRPDEVRCFSGDPSRLQVFAQWTPRYSLACGISEGLRELKETVR
jgi:UDP-glucose 4-epimerase